MSSTMAWNMVVSLTLAAVTTAVSGSPLASQIRCSLDPGLPRSTGFAPTWSPALGPHAHGVHARLRPVQLALLAEAIQHLQVELVEHAGVDPFAEPPPAGRRRAAAELAGRQQPPGSRGAGHEHDRGQAGPVGDGAVPAAVGRPRRSRQQGRATSAHSSSDTRSSARAVMTPDPARPTPKGAKQRLSA